jgi:quinate dehydrogenase (quinone)
VRNWFSDQSFECGGVVRRLSQAFAAVLVVLGLFLVIGGGWLIGLGGSFYYLIAGLVYGAAGILLWRERFAGPGLVVAMLVLTLVWAVWESGTYYWALFPRLLVPLGLAMVALALAPTGTRVTHLRATYGGTAALAVIFVVFFAAAFFPHGELVRASDDGYVEAKVDNKPVDWSAYAGTTAGLRYAPFNQINKSNVGELKVAWTYRAGDGRTGVESIDQNTPLAIGDTVYSCRPQDLVSALDADTGALRWKYDAKASSPIWNRCRSLGYFADSTAPARAVCAQRLLMTTIDARLIALDTKTGVPCPGFGRDGVVDLKQGMGEVRPGFYFQTSAPTVARDKVVIGGWVTDNQQTGEPSGVIRAFNARTGAFEWAWDLGNPANIKGPPPGQTYTRGTPNMWTTAAFDDKLGLIYLPLGNATPDYFGMNRPAHSDQYNSSIVAVDIETGVERWKFQTVHHDIWDYDLPSQPALIDAPDGKGGAVPGILVGTKRGQIFYLNRADGTPLAEIAEKPVPQDGAVPEEKLSPTQPFSVGMPTIGAEHLTEKKMWGATMFDQLVCRILFKQLRYEGDLTPPGLTHIIQQPGNGGGMNWWSVSYDPVNQIMITNDIRVPSALWLVPRALEAESNEKYPPASDGHGASPMRGTPYAVVTLFWMSPIGAPCNQPPFGTVTAVDMKTRQIVWEVPGGTAETTGPFEIASHMKMPIGMPTYGGTATTAGGLTFFAGTQDYYMRAFDSYTGKLLWEYPLPVGSSATPMSYVSPKTGKQYIVIVAGGAAHQLDHTGDYVIAFALPDKK